MAPGRFFSVWKSLYAAVIPKFAQNFRQIVEPFCHSLILFRDSPVRTVARLPPVNAVNHLVAADPFHPFGGYGGRPQRGRILVDVRL